jgi:hypothetical protein
MDPDKNIAKQAKGVNGIKIIGKGLFTLKINSDTRLHTDIK